MARHTLAIVALVAAVTATLPASVKIKTHQDERFAFTGLKTWAWHSDGAGEVKMMLTKDDDPEAVRMRFEPTITQTVASELQSRGWVPATSGPPDMLVNYYLLISSSTSAQTIGQFVPAVAEWGLPPLTGATQSFKVIEQGSLVLDVISPAITSVVWRGIAQAEIDREKSDDKRRERIREALRDMLKKFPKAARSTTSD